MNINTRENTIGFCYGIIFGGTCVGLTLTFLVTIALKGPFPIDIVQSRKCLKSEISTAIMVVCPKEAK